MKQPIYFLVAFWGSQYRDYFVDRCLPSLLAPNNLPILKTADGHHMVMATTREDWQAIEDLPIMSKLRDHVTLTHIEMAPQDVATPPGSSPAILQQNAYQKKLVELAYRDRAYGCLVWPDLIFSDGMVAALVGHAQAGRKCVLCAALRQTEETVIAELEQLGHIKPGPPPSQTGKPIVLSPRLVADLAVRHLHSEIRICEEDRPGQPLLTIHRYWQIPGRRGIILHSFLYAPFLMDYASLDSHDTQCLDEEKFEDVYIARNFRRAGDIHVVQDSDEFGIISLTPSTITQVPEMPSQQRRGFWDSKTARQWGIRISFLLNAKMQKDPLKLALFRRAVLWHADDLDEVWRRRERETSAMIEAALGDHFSAAERGLVPHRISLDPRRLPIDLYVNYLQSPKTSFGMRLIGYFFVIARALTGGQNEWKRIGASVVRRAKRRKSSGNA